MSTISVGLYRNNGTCTGSFSGQIPITTNRVERVRYLVVADIDNDGDMEVLSASQNDDKIAWYRVRFVF